jgi:outer membrane protein
MFEMIKRMKKQTIIITLFLIGINLSQAQNRQDTLLMNEAVTLAVENNHSILIADLEKQKAVFQQKENKSNLLPHIEAYSTFSYYYAIPKMVIPGEIFGQEGNIPVEFGTKYDWNSGLKFSQLIYNQSYFTSLKLISEMIELQELNVQLKKEEVAFQVSKLYCLCQTIDNQLIEMDSTIANLQKLKSIVELQKANDMARQADVERFEIDISKVKIERQKLAEHLAQQLNLLKLFTGQDIDTEMILSKSISTNEIDRVENTNYSRIELQLLDQQKKTAALQIAIEKQSYLPTLTAFGQHYYQGMRDEFDFFDGGDDRFFKSGIVGLQLNIPVFDGFARRNRIKMQEIEIRKLQTQVSQTELFDAKEKCEAWQNYENSMQELNILNDNIKSAQNIYRANLMGYRQQAVSLTDLIISENQLAESRISYYNALFKVKSAELKLKKLYGILLNDSF